MHADHAALSSGPDGKIHSDLIGHAATMKRIAAEMQVPLIDLQAESIAYLDKAGEHEGDKLAITKKDDDRQDHLRQDAPQLDAGSFVFGRIVAVDLGNVVPALHRYVLRQPRCFRPRA